MKFQFKDKKYDKDKQYFFVIYDDATELEVFRHPVIMDMAFAEDYGFGLAYAVLLVHHEIADGEVGTGAYLLPNGLFAPLLPPQARRHELGVRQYRQFQRGVFYARGQPARRDNALTR